MLLKCHLGVKCHSKNIQVIRLLQHSSANSKIMRVTGDALYVTWRLPDLETIMILFLLAFNFIAQRSHSQLTNNDEVTDQGLCYCNSNAWGWHNSHYSGVIGIIYQNIFQNGKTLRSV